MGEKRYVVIVQCHIVKQRCSGYFCELALTERTGGFSSYPADQDIRHLNITCGGCCGRATHRKLSHLVKQLWKRERISKDQIVVHLSSCITKDNYHGPPCPHLGYLRELIGKLGLDVVHDTTISQKAEERRFDGIYRTQPE